MQKYATFQDQMNASKPMVYDSSSQVVYSKYTTFDVFYTRLYVTCRCFSQQIGRIAGL
jgi:hypothetical protein